MSAEQTDSLTFLLVGLTSGLVKYFSSVQLNIPFLSGEFLVAMGHAGITAGFCGAMGWAGKKIIELAYHNCKKYFIKRKTNK